LTGLFTNDSLATAITRTRSCMWTDSAALKRLGVSAAARLSAYFYNTTDELEQLVDVLTHASQGRQVARST
jgi:selenocysteine lyase/cysteine desulfurase